MTEEEERALVWQQQQKIRHKFRRRLNRIRLAGSDQARKDLERDWLPLIRRHTSKLP